jgi:hypothetical protein
MELDMRELAEVAVKLVLSPEGRDRQVVDPERVAALDKLRQMAMTPEASALLEAILTGIRGANAGVALVKVNGQSARTVGAR